MIERLSFSFFLRPIPFILLICFVLGCPEPSEPSSDDSDSGWELGPDAGDVSGSDEDIIDFDVEDDTGPAFFCPVDFGAPAEGCDLVAQDDCPGGAFCQLALTGGATTPRPLCIALSHAGPKDLHQDCSTFEEDTRCQPGLLCAGWGVRDPRDMACSQFCLLETGEGCAPDSYCSHHFQDIPGYGLCIPRCDPYDEGSCPSDYACAPDPTYATERTCWPEFRCLKNTVPATTTYKRPCDIDALHLSAGCPEGLTCYPSGVAQLCVKPCTSDDDCSGIAEGLTCSEPRGELDLRYCD